jgi:hypothetical protein
MRINRRNKDVKNTLGRFHHTAYFALRITLSSPGHENVTVSASSTEGSAENAQNITGWNSTQETTV